MRIALDAMGGDRAPAEIVAGAVAASARGVDVLLVGDREVLGGVLGDLGADLPIVDAPDVVGMGEAPVRAVREKPGSSVAVCARLVRDREAAGFVSAGSTGAAMATASIIMGRLPRVLRPTIASVIPVPDNPVVLLDSGANPEVRSEHLVQFAAMGAEVSRVHHGEERPRIGLLNIGEEPGKGRALEQQAWELLARSGLRFVGNVEGRDIPSGVVDVLVTDGFTGNIVLKTMEGAVSLALGLVSSALGAAGGDVGIGVSDLLEPVRSRLDYETIGGAHLLGTDGVVVIAHGSSSRTSIENALVLARDGAERGLVERIAARVGSL